MSSNGLLSPSELAPIPDGQLRKDAARAYNALNKFVGGKLEHAGEGACYRPLGRQGDYDRGGPFTQWYAWGRYQAGGNLAATPGQSNHGLGVACDFRGNGIALVKQYGEQFGWKKTEAFNEPWHYCYVPGSYAAVDKYSAVAPGETMRFGDNGPGVVVLKKRLRVWRAWPLAWKIDGGFGPRCDKQVKAFQKARGLKPDGIVGPGTWKVLNSAPLIKKRPQIFKPKPIAKPINPRSRYFADIFADDSYNAAAYSSAGYPAIVLKATEGHDFVDKAFAERWAASSHLTRWAYHFARPSNNSPELEAANFAKVVHAANPHGLEPTDRLVLDWEDPKFEGRDGTDWVAKFVRALNSYGLELRVLYSYGDYLRGTINKWPESTSGPLRYWHAAYNKAPTANIPPLAAGHLVAVQYTDGVNGNSPHEMIGIGKCDISYIPNKKR
jgi:hypothetical protein